MVNIDAIKARIAELEAEYPNPLMATIQDEPDWEIRMEYARLKIQLDWHSTGREEMK